MNALGVRPVERRRTLPDRGTPMHPAERGAGTRQP